MSNRWDVMAVREYQQNGQTKSAWTRVGTGWTNKDGSISVELDAIPKDFRVILQVPLTKEQREARWGNSQQGGPRQGGGGFGGQQQPRPQSQPQQMGGGNQQRWNRGAPPPQQQPPPYPQEPDQGYPPDWDQQQGGNDPGHGQGGPFG